MLKIISKIAVEYIRQILFGENYPKQIILAKDYFTMDPTAESYIKQTITVEDSV